MNPVFKTVIQWLLSTILLMMAVVSQAAAPSLEQRVQKLSAELRCLVCQNQSLAESHAELALNLKQQIREKFQQGQSEKEVIDFLVARYGDFVHYRPPLNYQTVLLWTGPYLVLLAALIFLFTRAGIIPGAAELIEDATADETADTVSTRHFF